MSFPRAAAKYLALQATMHALFSVALALPLAWLTRDLVGAHPQGVRALFADGSVFALDVFFKGDLQITTASSWVLSAAILLFLGDAAISARYFERVRVPELTVTPVRAFLRVLLTRIVIAILLASLVALFGFLTSLIAHRLGPNTSDRSRDVFAVSGYALGLIVSLPLILLRDVWLTDSANAAPVGQRLKTSLVALRLRFFSLSAHYIARGALAAILFALAVFFVRATESWLTTLLLLVVSRVLVGLRVIVRGTFYVQTANALAQGDVAVR